MNTRHTTTTHSPKPWSYSLESAKVLSNNTTACQQTSYGLALSPSDPLTTAKALLPQEAPPSPVPNAPVVIDYLLDGPRNAGAVFSGRSQLVGVTYASPGQQPQHQSDGIAAVLGNYSSHRCIYYDSVLAFAIALHYELPFPHKYDDIRAMLSLLQHPPSNIIQHAESLRAPKAVPDSVEASLARVQEIQRLTPQLHSRIEAEGLTYVYREIEIPVVIPTATMAAAGVPCKKKVLARLRNDNAARRSHTRRELQRLAGPRFNPDDERKTRDFLFGELGLPSQQMTSSGELSTCKNVLKHLKQHHPAVPVLLDYRAAKSVLNSTRALLASLDTATRVHPDLDPFATITGRYTCKSPPMHSLDARVREAIVAPAGCQIMEFDYSQIELRVLAHFSQDPGLLDAFHRGDDLHRRTAAKALSIPEDEITADNRELGKKLNFGIIYGQTAYGLAKEFGMSLAEAESLLAAYDATYPKVTAWIATTHKQAAVTGEVRTLYGRRRYLPNINVLNLSLVRQAQRHAVNTVIQGTAADLIKLALIRLNKILPGEVRLVLSVHDSVVLEVPQGLVSEVEKMATDVMQAPPPGFSVPLVVDVGVGRTWADCKAR